MCSYFFSTQSNDIQLLYFGREQIEPNRPQSISVPILEQYWQRQDGQSTNREHLIMALADVEAILIKATYTTNTREAAWVFSLCSFARHLWKILNVYFLHFILCVHLVRVLTIKMLQEFHTTYPWPPCGSLPSTACFCTQTCPHPVTFLLIGSGYFQAKPFPV